jgi:hypothetical protein
MPCLLDFLIGIRKALCPPWKRRLRDSHAAVGLAALAFAGVVVWWVVRWATG